MSDFDFEPQPSVKEPFLTGRRNRDELIEEMRIKLATRPFPVGSSAAGVLGPSALIYIVAILGLAGLALYLALG
jgi:hypothetical protein